MKKAGTVLKPFIAFCVLTIVYAALTERFSFTNLATGACVSAVALILTRFFFLKDSKPPLIYSVYYFVFIFYIIYLILKSAAVSVLYILGKSTDIVIVRYETTLCSDSLKCLLANAVTLTPGTVTADIKGNKLEVLMLCKAGLKDRTAVLCKIEKILKRMDGGGS